MSKRRAFVLLVGLAVACGCSSKTDDAPATGTATCDKPGYACDVDLAPPEVGLQFKVGPIDVPKGEEVLRCFWRKVPRDAEISNVELTYNHGSHHLDVFTTPYAMPDGDFDCSRPEVWGTWPSEVPKGLPDKATMPRMVVGFQNDSVKWKLPADVSYKLKAGQQLLIQSHYANGTAQETPTGRLLVFVNFGATANPTTHHAETLFDEDTDIVIPPQSAASLTRICEYPSPVNIIGMFTHFHSRGKRFSVYAYDVATKTQGELLYQNTNWTDPPWYTEANWGKAVTTSAIKMVAEYNNLEDREIKWGFFVGENEHMETYVMSYPALDVDPTCICHREGEAPTNKSCP